LARRARSPRRVGSASANSVELKGSSRIFIQPIY
jgi:hypothetical protein